MGVRPEICEVCLPGTRFQLDMGAAPTSSFYPMVFCARPIMILIILLPLVGIVYHHIFGAHHQLYTRLSYGVVIVRATQDVQVTSTATEHQHDCSSNSSSNNYSSTYCTVVVSPPQTEEEPTDAWTKRLEGT